MNGELTVLPLMYSVTVTSNGQIFAESNETIISTMCLKKQENWPHESVECNIQIQLDDVDINKLTPLKYDFGASHATNRIDLAEEPSMQKNNHHWRVSHVKMASRLQTIRTANDGNDQISLKKSTTLELNITFLENISLFSQLCSVPVMGRATDEIYSIYTIKLLLKSSLN